MQPMKGTIKSKKDIERLFQSGRRSSSSCMTVLSLPVQEHVQGRCAFIAGKKLGSAPDRNRCKRVLRAAARESGAPWVHHDVVFIAHRKAMFESYYKVVDQVKENLLKLGIVDD